MLTRRLIACLDVRDGEVVKGVEFDRLAPAGDPAVLAARHAHSGIDEIVMLDISATIEGRRTQLETIRRVAQTLFIPFTAGGGIATERAACDVIEAGADKVSVNSAALADPPLITRIAKRYGSQAVVVAIDARSEGGRAEVYSRSGTAETRRSAREWAVEAADRGAGEVLLTAIHRDGTKQGFDTALTAEVSVAVPIPVIASGGAGSLDHFAAVFAEGRADAALAASIFHFNQIDVGDLKRSLAALGIPVRLC